MTRFLLLFIYIRHIIVSLLFLYHYMSFDALLASFPYLIFHFLASFSMQLLTHIGYRYYALYFHASTYYTFFLSFIFSQSIFYFSCFGLYHKGYFLLWFYFSYISGIFLHIFNIDDDFIFYDIFRLYAGELYSAILYLSFITYRWWRIYFQIFFYLFIRAFIFIKPHADGLCHATRPRMPLYCRARAISRYYYLRQSIQRHNSNYRLSRPASAAARLASPPDTSISLPGQWHWLPSTSRRRFGISLFRPHRLSATSSPPHIRFKMMLVMLFAISFSRQYYFNYHYDFFDGLNIIYRQI